MKEGIFGHLDSVMWTSLVPFSNNPDFFHFLLNTKLSISLSKNALKDLFNWYLISKAWWKVQLWKVLGRLPHSSVNIDRCTFLATDVDLLHFWKMQQVDVKISEKLNFFLVPLRRTQFSKKNSLQMWWVGVCRRRPKKLHFSSHPIYIHPDPKN